MVQSINIAQDLPFYKTQTEKKLGSIM